ADALRDGTLIDVSTTAREAGIRWPVALTCAAWGYLLLLVGLLGGLVAVGLTGLPLFRPLSVGAGLAALRSGCREPPTRLGLRRRPGGPMWPASRAAPPRRALRISSSRVRWTVVCVLVRRPQLGGSSVAARATDSMAMAANAAP